MKREIKRPADERLIRKHLTLIVAAMLITACGSLLTVQAQTGGPYDLTHSVIAGGGSESTGSTYNLSGTAGQQVAGTSSGSTPPRYDMHGGFWFQTLRPTAAGVTVSGRILTPDGYGLRNAIVKITDSRGAVRSAVSSTFGYYYFEGVQVGESYLITVNSRRFSFTPLFITVNDTLTGLDFIGYE